MVQEFTTGESSAEDPGGEKEETRKGSSTVCKSIDSNGGNLVNEGSNTEVRSGGSRGLGV